MLTVSHDVSVVESDLLSGLLSCPSCSGRLRSWGRARSRTIRHGIGGVSELVEHQPRRGRCALCRRTHVLLPVVLAARRADSAEVIASAIEAKTIKKEGHRVIAARLRRPASTVRDWLRSFAASAGQIADTFTALVLRDAVDAAAIWAAPSAVPGGALSALMVYAKALGDRFGAVVTVAWVQAGITVCNGWLFCRPWWAGRPNTNPPLPSEVTVGHAGRSVCPDLVAGVFPAS